MAHEGQPLSTTRIVPFETFYDDHSLEGTNFNKKDLLLHNGIYWFVIKEGDDFHLRKAELQYGGRWRLYAQDSYGFVYRPIHPDMKAEDIEGAVYAHDDGTHWLFAHCSPDEQIDYAADVRTFALEQFSLAILNAQVKVDESTNNVVKAEKIATVKALVKFAEAVGNDCYTTIISATLGHYHKDRHHDHKREIVITSITKIMEAWRVAGETDKAVRLEHQDVSLTATTIKTSLSQTHTIEWRHARVKRLEAEKKAAEAAAAETETETSQGD